MNHSFRLQIYRIRGTYEFWEKPCSYSCCQNIGFKLYLYFDKGFVDPILKGFFHILRQQKERITLLVS